MYPWTLYWKYTVESFGCLANNEYHFWVDNAFSGFKASSAIAFVRKVPLLKPLIPFMISSDAIKANLQNTQIAITKGQNRMAQGESPGGRRDFMTYMLRKNRDGEAAMSPQEIMMNCPFLVNAGSETTATALSGLFFFLASTPKAYAAVVDEIRSTFTSEADINMRSTAPLEYVQACIDEALRMYPPVLFPTPRVSNGEVVGGYHLPEGTEIRVYTWAAFRNPHNFAHPDSFVPERWLPPSHPRYQPRFAGDNRAVFKPFSFGPRDCVGKNLAYAEMRVIVTRFLFNFDYSLAPGMEDWQDSQKVFFFWEKGPLMLKLKRRTDKA